MMEYNEMDALELGMSLFTPLSGFWGSRVRRFKELSADKLVKEYKEGVYIAE